MTPVVRPWIAAAGRNEDAVAFDSDDNDLKARAQVP